MTPKKIVLFIFAIFALSATSFGQSAEKTLAEIQSLFEGTWQVNNKAQYEKWEKSGSKFAGKGYKVVENQEKISERLEIVIDNGVVTYLATVPNQNNGATVKFPLTSTKDNKFVFENPQHDFPKVISYQKVSDNELIAFVSDGGKKGFSQTMKRVQPSSVPK